MIKVILKDSSYLTNKNLVIRTSGFSLTNQNTVGAYTDTFKVVTFSTTSGAYDGTSPVATSPSPRWVITV